MRSFPDMPIICQSTEEAVKFDLLDEKSISELVERMSPRLLFIAQL